MITMQLPSDNTQLKALKIFARKQPTMLLWNTAVS